MWHIIKTYLTCFANDVTNKLLNNGVKQQITQSLALNIIPKYVLFIRIYSG